MNRAPVPAGIYLRELPDPLLPARASAGAAARARRLQAFLAPLERIARPHFELHGHSELWVVSAQDWSRITGVPYGWPFTRTRPTPGSRAGAEGPASAIVVAAEVPGRLLRRFDPILLAAARAGVRPPVDPAGATLEGAPLARADARELFDLVVGHEWGHALAVAAGLRTRVKWLDELLATTLFLAALRELGADEVLRRFLAWADVQVVGGAWAAEAAAPRFGRQGRPVGPLRRDLGAFETPRGRLRLPELVWFQGTFSLRAWELVREGGWGFARRLHAELDGVNLGRGADARGAVARALIRVEPSFRDWFRTFGVEA